MKIERGDILMVNLGQVPGTSFQSIIQKCGHVSSDAMRRQILTMWIFISCK